MSHIGNLFAKRILRPLFLGTHCLDHDDLISYLKADLAVHVLVCINLPFTYQRGNRQHPDHRPIKCMTPCTWFRHMASLV